MPFSLAIRPYSVVPLNEKCGLIEWVPNIVILRGILTKAYLARGIPAWVSSSCDARSGTFVDLGCTQNNDLKALTDSIRMNEETAGERFEKEVIVK